VKMVFELSVTADVIFHNALAFACLRDHLRMWIFI
jgi:hypothetical protein